MLYLEIAWFHFQRFFTYPFEIIAELLKRVVWIVLMIFLWSVISKSSRSIEIAEILPYFLIATGVRDIVMARWGILGTELYHAIKEGKISNYLIKPLSVVPAYYAKAFGKHGLRFLMSIGFIVTGIVLASPKVTSFAAFIILMLNAILVGFAYNVLEGSLTFVVTETNGLTNAMQHLIQVLSGSMAPLYLFPSNLKTFALFTPFPAMVYGPSRALTQNSFSPEIVALILSGTFWALVLNLIAFSFWNWTKKRYEAVGI